MSNILDIGNIGDVTFLKIGSYHLGLFLLIKYAIATLVFIGGLYIVHKSIYRIKVIDESKKYSIYNLVKYIFIVIYVLVLLQLSGFKLSILLAGSAALLVGVGIGLQNLFNDFISGIILLIDSSIKVNDVIQINDMVCKVEEIKLRTTTVVTRDDIHILVPNSSLTRNNINNYTHDHTISRFHIEVGVSYDSDIERVILLLKKAANNNRAVKSKPSPMVVFNDFGDSALKFTLYFWSDEIFYIENIKSEMRIDILNSFRENGITIPFPQRVIHSV